MTQPWWSRYRHWFGAFAVLAAFAWSSTARIGVALRDPGIAQRPAEALLRTDPAFLYYVTERVVENGGAWPAELRADPNVEWPHVTDVAAIETVGQELLVAWTYLVAGKPMPLHLWSIWVMSLWASLVAFGVYGMAYELTREVRFAALAALLWAALLGNYRTLGFVLIREDFAFPWIAAHLWLALRAARTRSWSDGVLAGLTALAAAATWHASGFVLAMEAACLVAWFLRSGENPFANARGRLALALVLLGSLAVPVLRAKHFALSLPMVLALALAATALVLRTNAPLRMRAAATFAAAVLLLLGASKAVALALGGGLADYGHVFGMLASKLAHFGRLPEDVAALDFETRLLWDGPFRTAEFETLARAEAAASLAALAGIVVGIVMLVRKRDERALFLPIAFVALAGLAAWMVERTVPLFGMTGAVLAVTLAWRLRAHAVTSLVLAAAIGWHGWDQVKTLADPQWRIAWYLPPPSADENVEMLAWVRANVPAGEPVASDFVTSAAILAFTRRPILNQPKYETRRSRELIEQMSNALYRATPSERVDDRRPGDGRFGTARFDRFAPEPTPVRRESDDRPQTAGLSTTEPG